MFTVTEPIVPAPFVEQMELVLHPQPNGWHVVVAIPQVNWVAVAWYSTTCWLGISNSFFLVGCPQHALLACGQWVICPTDAQGKNSDCSKAPHIVSNSWGGAGGQTWFNDVIKAWNAAGIIGFFAIGNDV